MKLYECHAECRSCFKVNLASGYAPELGTPPPPPDDKNAFKSYRRNGSQQFQMPIHIWKDRPYEYTVLQSQHLTPRPPPHRSAKLWRFSRDSSSVRTRARRGARFTGRGSCGFWCAFKYIIAKATIDITNNAPRRISCDWKWKKKKMCAGTFFSQRTRNIRCIRVPLFLDKGFFRHAHTVQYSECVRRPLEVSSPKDLDNKQSAHDAEPSTDHIPY